MPDTIITTTDNNNNVEQTVRSNSDFVHLNTTYNDGESPSLTSSRDNDTKDYLSLHIPIDGEFAGAALHLENQDNNNSNDNNCNEVIKDMNWITLVKKRPNISQDILKTSLWNRNGELGNNVDRNIQPKKRKD